MPGSDPSDVPVKDAATLVLLRRGGPHEEARVLMGQRGSGAVFMPDKFVFPGGRVDRADAGVPLDPGLAPGTAAALCRDGPPIAHALAAAAIRELWEETGLALGRPATAPCQPPPGWEAFFGRGLLPSAASLRFIFRAVTPPGRPRRYDARFFLCDAGEIAGDPDDFSAAGSELRHIGWIPLGQARALDLPFVTRVVLSEIGALLADPDSPRPIPFFDNSGPFSRYRPL